MTSPYANLQLVTPKALDALPALLEQGYRPLAGATSLMKKIQQGAMEEGRFFSLRAIPELSPRISLTDDDIIITATATVTDLITHPHVRARYPELINFLKAHTPLSLRNQATLIGTLLVEDLSSISASLQGATLHLFPEAAPIELTAYLDQAAKAPLQNVILSISLAR